jgi:glucosamine-6-phosphate deaminase
MEVVICTDEARVGELAAAKIARVAREAGPEAVLGVATGSSPLRVYEALAARIAAGTLDLTRAYAFALDEYVGLPRGHAQGYAEVIRRTVTEPLGMMPERVKCPDGFAADLELACEEFEAAIRAVGGVDVQLLGIGSNGHIGFNEPSSSLSSRTRIKTLATRTRLDNQRFFASLDEVPMHCVTQGLGTIMEARHVVLTAQGPAKAHAIAAVVEGPVSAMCPGSILQMHPDVTVIIDEAAASELTLRDYYVETYANKPAWQSFED